LREMEFCDFVVGDFHFFSKPDFCVVRTQMTTKKFKLFPQTPTMVVWNHMNERMTPKALLWGRNELFLLLECVFHLSSSAKTLPFRLKTGF
jgi:hypothetical protein